MRLLFIPFALSLVACGGATMGAPKIANPVLLGPVDRVGGHRTELSRDGHFVAATTQTSLMIAGYTGSRVATGQLPVTVAVLDATEAHDDEDVRIEKLEATGFAMIFCGLWYSDTLELRGHANKVKR